MPTLAEALTEIGRRALVCIEIKIPYGEVGPLERRVCDILIDHKGPACVVGFNPYSHAWFADHHPMILRGLTSYSYTGPDARHLAPEMRKRYAQLGHVSIARPHFLALGLDVLPSPKADALRGDGLPVIAWTVDQAARWDAVKSHCDNLIFEGFAA
jgi:glycerophosphoryl diester phosphodiesterase